jgi:outer membrane biosynthesis protein TonB
MKPAFHLLSLAALLASLNACRTASPQATNVGPFDANGNYVEAWADDPSKWRAYQPKDVEGDPPVIAKHEQPPDHSTPIVLPPAEPERPSPVKPVAASPRPKPTSTHIASRSSTTNKPRTTPASTPKPKPKPVVAKAKPKPKPAPVVRYTIKKGDSLSTIAARHGTTVTALKSANGISGTLIREGKTLVIPRRK